MADSDEDRLRAAAAKIQAADNRKAATEEARRVDEKRAVERERELQLQAQSLRPLIDQQVKAASDKLANAGVSDRFSFKSISPASHVVAGWAINVVRSNLSPRGALARPDVWISLHKSGALIAGWHRGNAPLPAEIIIDQSKSVPEQIGEVLLKLYERVADSEG